jgi:hypothetical protein
MSEEVDGQTIKGYVISRKALKAVLAYVSDYDAKVGELLNKAPYGEVKRLGLHVEEPFENVLAELFQDAEVQPELLGYCIGCEEAVLSDEDGGSAEEGVFCADCKPTPEEIASDAQLLPDAATDVAA